MDGTAGLVAGPLDFAARLERFVGAVVEQRVRNGTADAFVTGETSARPWRLAGEAFAIASYDAFYLDTSGAAVEHMYCDLVREVKGQGRPMPTSFGASAPGF